MGKKGIYKKHFVVIFFLLAAPQFVSAQDAYFSQFFINQLYYNPAFAGFNKDPEILLSYRNYLLASQTTYLTYGASYNQYLDAVHGGVGLQLMRDQQGSGIFNKTSIDAMYAYHLKMNRFFSLQAGFQVSYMMKNFDNSNLILPDMFNPSTGDFIPTQAPVASYHKNFPDFSLGILGMAPNFYMGFSAHHVTEPNEAFDAGQTTRLSRKYTFITGMTIPLKNIRYGKEVVTLNPALLFQNEKSFQQLNYGLLIKFSPLSAGIWAREDKDLSFNSLIFSIGYNQDFYEINYSYDMAVSSIKRANFAVHEVTFRIKFKYNKTRKLHEAIKCPKI